MRPCALRLLAAPTLIATTLPLQAFDVNDQFSADGFILGAGQCQNVSALLPGETYGEVLDDALDPLLLDDSMTKFGNECAGAMPFQVELNYHPDDYNEFFAVIGFAASNGLADDSPWILSPFAADLEDDVRNINGRKPGLSARRRLQAHLHLPERRHPGHLDWHSRFDLVCGRQRVRQ